MADQLPIVRQNEPPVDDPHWTSPSSYRRIRIVNREDIEATYPLIAAYVQSPELASTVDELAADPDSWPGIRYRCSFSAPNSELEEPAKPVREDAHAAIETYVKDLGLGNATTNKMIDALRWKKAHLKAEKPPVPNGFAMHNREYAYTATAVLLSLTKNVETLYLGDMNQETPLEDYLLLSNYGKLASPGLQKLKTLQYLAVDRYDPRGYDELDFLAHIRCFHRLPALRTIAMDGVMEYQKVTRGMFPPRTGSFKSLSITHVDISGGMLSIMMRIPRVLEEFTLSFGGLWHTDAGGPYVKLKTLGKSLLEHKATLKHLDLDLGNVGWGNTPEEEHTPENDDDHDNEEIRAEQEEMEREYFDEWYHIDKGESTGPRWSHELPNTRPYGLGIGSLHDFAALTHLSIGLNALLGHQEPKYVDGDYITIFNPPFRLVDALPPSLESLRVYGYLRGQDAAVDEHVDELMAKRGERLPNLKDIQGVEEHIAVMPERSSDIGEDEVWERPAVEVHWVRKDEL